MDIRRRVYEADHEGPGSRFADGDTWAGIRGLGAVVVVVDDA